MCGREATRAASVPLTHCCIGGTSTDVLGAVERCVGPAHPLLWLAWPQPTAYVTLASGSLRTWLVKEKWLSASPSLLLFRLVVAKSSFTQHCLSCGGGGGGTKQLFVTAVAGLLGVTAFVGGMQTRVRVPERRTEPDSP